MNLQAKEKSIKIDNGAVIQTTAIGVINKAKNITFSEKK